MFPLHNFQGRFYNTEIARLRKTAATLRDYHKNKLAKNMKMFTGPRMYKSSTTYFAKCNCSQPVVQPLTYSPPLSQTGFKFYHFQSELFWIMMYCHGLFHIYYKQCCLLGISCIILLLPVFTHKSHSSTDCVMSGEHSDLLLH